MYKLLVQCTHYFVIVPVCFIFYHTIMIFFWIWYEKVEFKTRQLNNNARLYFPLKENVHYNELSVIKVDIYTKYKHFSVTVKETRG